MGNPKYLDLDDLETSDSDITVRHKGVDHVMRTLTVDAFIAQQKRAALQQKLAAEAKDVGDSEMASVVELIRDSIVEFFPTLPVGEMPTAKLFVIFAWLNEMSSKINELSSPDSGEGVEQGSSAEGKAEAAQS